MSNTIIDLIRHGEPVGGRAYRGHTIDDPLSEKGWQQMWDAIADHCPWDIIISSPLQRCLSFARTLAENNGLELVVEDDLKEVGFGSWEGRTPDQIKQQSPDEYTNFYNDPVNLRPEGAEPLDEFIRRTTRCYEKILERYQQKHVLIVSHAGVMRSIIAHTLHAKQIGLYRITINNASISRIRATENGNMLELLNSSLK
ncbi:MAG: histidine phosphatase family protein [Gammaproteobacteria bacterium]|nr:histidine phosphatase family protein [Gammaproteobacteria bacterium]